MHIMTAINFQQVTPFSGCPMKSAANSSPAVQPRYGGRPSTVPMRQISSKASAIRNLYSGQENVLLNFFSRSPAGCSWDAKRSCAICCPSIQNFSSGREEMRTVRFQKIIRQPNISTGCMPITQILISTSTSSQKKQESTAPPSTGPYGRKQEKIPLNSS